MNKFIYGGICIDFNGRYGNVFFDKGEGKTELRIVLKEMDYSKVKIKENKISADYELPFFRFHKELENVMGISGLFFDINEKEIILYIPKKKKRIASTLKDFACMDFQFNLEGTIVYQILPIWVMAFKRRAIFHASAVAKDNKAIIFAGGRRSGKSSFLFECLKDGLDFICDEHIAYKNKKIYRTFKLVQIYKPNWKYAYRLGFKKVGEGANRLISKLHEIYWQARYGEWEVKRYFYLNNEKRCTELEALVYLERGGSKIIFRNTKEIPKRLEASILYEFKDTIDGLIYAGQFNSKYLDMVERVQEVVKKESKDIVKSTRKVFFIRYPDKILPKDIYRIYKKKII